MAGKDGRSRVKFRDLREKPPIGRNLAPVTPYTSTPNLRNGGCALKRIIRQTGGRRNDLLLNVFFRGPAALYKQREGQTFIEEIEKEGVKSNENEQDH
ncbi:MAG TPA: hypothetical protein VMM38_11640 [Aridibacter sp.]|nr:hypothetical protein [Aridibacter sp.]